MATHGFSVNSTIIVAFPSSLEFLVWAIVLLIWAILSIATSWYVKANCKMQRSLKTSCIHFYHFLFLGRALQRLPLYIDETAEASECASSCPRGHWLGVTGSLYLGWLLIPCPLLMFITVRYPSGSGPFHSYNKASVTITCGLALPVAFAVAFNFEEWSGQSLKSCLDMMAHFLFFCHSYS